MGRPLFYPRSPSVLRSPESILYLLRPEGVLDPDPRGSVRQTHDFRLPCRVHFRDFTSDGTYKTFVVSPGTETSSLSYQTLISPLLLQPLLTRFSDDELMSDLHPNLT